MPRIGERLEYDVEITLLGPIDDYGRPTPGHVDYVDPLTMFSKKLKRRSTASVKHERVFKIMEKE